MAHNSREALKLLSVCSEILEGKCVFYHNTILWRGTTQINTIAPYKMDDLAGLTRISINLLREPLSASIKDKIYKLPKLNDLPSMEVTMLDNEAEIIGVWLGLAAIGVEPSKPVDLLCWPTGDYAWTIAAAIVGEKAKIVTMT